MSAAVSPRSSFASRSAPRASRKIESRFDVFASSARVMAGSPHQRGQAVAVFSVDVDAGVEKSCHDRRVGAACRIDDRALAVVVERIRVGAVFEQQRHGVGFAVEGGGGERPFAAPAGNVRVGPVVDEQADGFGAVGLSCVEKSGVEPSIERAPTLAPRSIMSCIDLYLAGLGRPWRGRSSPRGPSHRPPRHDREESRPRARSRDAPRRVAQPSPGKRRPASAPGRFATAPDTDWRRERRRLDGNRQGRKQRQPKGRGHRRPVRVHCRKAADPLAGGA